MIAERFRVRCLKDLAFREYEVWQEGCEPQTVMAIDATSAAENVHRERDERSAEYTAGPADWQVRNKRSRSMMTVRVTGEIVVEYSGVVLGGVEPPETSGWYGVSTEEWPEWKR